MMFERQNPNLLFVFALFLSWGPPHTPFGSAPPRFETMYDPSRIELPPNVPEAVADDARGELAGYYGNE